MPSYNISLNGQSYKVDGPDGYSPEQAYGDLSKSLGIAQADAPAQAAPQDEFGAAVDQQFGSSNTPSYPNAQGQEPQATNQDKGFWNNLTSSFFERSPDNQRRMVDSGLGAVARLATGSPTDKQIQDQAANMGSTTLKSTPFMKALEDQMSTLYESGQGDSIEYKTLDSQYQKEKMWNKQFDPKAPPTINDIPQVAKDLGKGLKEAPANLRASFRDDAGGTIARMFVGIAKDPELLVAPMGWDAAAAKGAQIASKISPALSTVGKVGGGLVGTGSIGAAITAPISAAEQMAKTGSVDYKQVGEDAINAGTATAMFAGLIKGVGSFGKMLKGTKTVANIVDESTKSGATFDQTVNNVLDAFGLNSADKAEATTHIQSAVVDEMSDFYRDFGPSPRSGAQTWNVSPLGRNAEMLTPDEAARFSNDNPPSGPFGLGVRGEGGTIPPVNERSGPLSESEAAGFRGAEQPSVLGQGTSGAEGGTVSPVGFQKGRILKPSEAERWAKRQTGEADPRLLAILGLTGVGAAGAYMLGSKPEDIAKYALALGGAALAGRALFKFAKGVGETTRFIAQKDTGYRIDNLLEPWDRNIAGTRRDNLRLNIVLKKIVPDTERGIAIRQHLQGDKTITLSPVEKQVADIIRQRFNEIGKEALDNKVIKDMLPDYVTGLYKGSMKSTRDLINDFMDSASKVGYNMSSNTPFALDKVFKTYEIAKEIKGLKAAHEHPADILRVYSDAMSKAIENKKLLESLKKSTLPDGTSPIQSWRKAPRDWATIVHPQLQGFKIHPDIAPSLKHVFSYSDPGLVFRSLQSLNFAAKRAAVSLSGFHLNALAESGLFGGINPITAVRMGQELFLNGKQLTYKGKTLTYNGKMADGVDILVRNGLKVGTEDIGGSSYEGFVRGMGKLVDTVVPIGKVGEKSAEGVIKLTQTMDRLTWDMAHTGIKVSVGLKEFEKMIQQNMDAHAADPRIPLKSLDEMAQHVSSYVNDIAGGLDWRRAAEGVQNKFFRKIALQATSPVGRQWMQLLAFAPDWTISNIRAAVKAIPGVTSKDIAQLHRSYVLRGALYYAIAGNALNMYFSGHPWWDNKDPTQIELGDGRHLLFSKHLIEPVRWLPFVGKPMQEALNKLAFLPKELTSQLTNKEYLSASNSSPPISRDTTKWYTEAGKRALHIGKQFTPITGQQLAQQGPGGLAGFFGHPIYGKSDEQRMQDTMNKDMSFETAVDNMFNQNMGR